MTTDPQSPRRRASTFVLTGAALVTLVLGGVATLLAALLEGREAAWGSLTGTAVVVGVFGLGALVVDQVAGLLPGAALLVALLTYTLQVVAMAALFLGLSGSGLLDTSIDRGWLAGTIVAGTLVWLVAHVLMAVRVRIPVYDLPVVHDEVNER